MDWVTPEFDSWSEEEESVKEIENGVVSEVKGRRSDALKGKTEISRSD